MKKALSLITRAIQFSTRKLHNTITSKEHQIAEPTDNATLVNTHTPSQPATK